MKRKGIFSLLKSERAQSMVEFAIILPILLLLLCVMVDFGRIIDARILVQSALSEGIRQVDSKDSIDVQVLNAISDYNDRLDFSKLQISSSAGSTIKKNYDYHVNSGSGFKKVGSYYTYFNTTVTLGYEVPVTMPVTSWFLGDSYTVSSTYTSQVFLDGYPEGGP